MLSRFMQQERFLAKKIKDISSIEYLNHWTKCIFQIVIKLNTFFPEKENKTVKM